MVYKVKVTKRAEEHLDNIVSYIINQLHDRSAAQKILEEVLDVYDKLEYMAETMPVCSDYYLRNKGYRKVVLPRHNYVIIYQVKDGVAIISGIFHMRENYGRKL
ncbi:type II toxin-antitoxin system RelE/ParE family toxin [Clostridiales bacterium COT073_COT-073]|nr:type II toxin-antitoxin system RelE/ParE family toxin [Clostridiales bacterium COT073_COT-073]